MVAPNPYKILGLRKAATPAQVRAAYRRLSKTTHPDVAGDTPENQAAFAQLKAAHDLLMDPARRAHYDKTRTWPAEPKDINPNAEVYQDAVNLIMSAYADSMAAGRDVNLVEIVRRQVTADIQKLQQNLQTTRQVVAAGPGIAAKIRARSGENVLSAAVLSSVEKAGAGIRQIELRVEHLKRLRAFIENYEFEMPVAYNVIAQSWA